MDELILRSEGATTARWLAALPAGLASSRPRLCLARTFVAVADGDVDAGGPPLDAAERAYADAVDEPFEPSVGSAASLLVNLPAIIALERAVLAHLRGDAEGTAASASRALAAIGEGEWMLDSVTRWHLAVAEWLRGRLPEAERAFASGIARWRQVGELTLAAWGGHYLGQVQRARGRLDAALGTYQQTLEITASPGRPALPASGVPQVGMAEVAYQREREYLVLARVLLAQGRPAQAVSLLERLHAAAVAQNRTGSIIEIQTLLGLALAASGEEAGAADALAGALTLACLQGYVRVFADEGTPMAALLGRLVAAQKTEQAAARGVSMAYLARLFRAFGQVPAMPDSGQDAVAAVPGLVERLTAREVEILVLLAAGMPNPRIAEQLVVSLDTVKKHVSHLLGKLGAANRTEAVTRARQLGLIP